MTYEQEIIEEFRRKYEGANTAGGGFIASNQMDSMVKDILSALSDYKERVKEELVGEYKENMQLLPNTPYNNGYADGLLKVLLVLILNLEILEKA